MQYFKDRTESFDDSYTIHAIVKERLYYDDGHVYNWIELFVSMYNKTIVTKNNSVLTKR
jgi:hypothetical protein